MKKRVIIKEKTAVAGAIEFILLIGLFAIVLSMIQLMYIPEIMEQKESDHMDEISNQFSRLKAMIDIQAKKNSTIPLSTLVTLDSKELPYFVTVPAQGELTIIDKEDTAYEINLSDGDNRIFKTFNLTSIKYKAYNHYFVPQTYVLEGGGVIIKQPGGKSVMWTEPNLVNSTKEEIYIDFMIPIFICNNDADNIGGYGNCYIRTNYSKELSDSSWISFNTVNTYYINISTEYSNAWYSFFNRTSDRYKEDINITINVTEISKNLKYVNTSIKLQDETDFDTITLRYKKIYIYTRVDMG